MVLGEPVVDRAALRDILMAFHPWRKGPLEIGGVAIDTEWRSDWKWERVQQTCRRGHRPGHHLGARVLDIGCGNGYFGWRMLAEGAALVVGIDPTLVFVMQWLACRHFAGDLRNYVLPLGIEDLPSGTPAFDAVFSMGVLYHRRDSLEHLHHIRSLLKPGRHAGVGNLDLAGARSGGGVEAPGSLCANAECVVRTAARGHRPVAGTKPATRAFVSSMSVKRVSMNSARTEWMRFESLAEALDPENPGLTVEGFPAPTRALFLARNARDRDLKQLLSWFGSISNQVAIPRASSSPF